MCGTVGQCPTKISCVNPRICVLVGLWDKIPHFSHMGACIYTPYIYFYKVVYVYEKCPTVPHPQFYAVCRPTKCPTNQISSISFSDSSPTSGILSTTHSVRTPAIRFPLVMFRPLVCIRFFDFKKLRRALSLYPPSSNA